MSGKKVMVEGANALMLDIDFGTYPYGPIHLTHTLFISFNLMRTAGTSLRPAAALEALQPVSAFPPAF
jgi:hypothetical protein